MNSPSQTFFNNINHGYTAAIFNENPLRLLPLYMAVATSCYYENYAKRCALQLYRASLSQGIHQLLPTRHVISQSH